MISNIKTLRYNKVYISCFSSQAQYSYSGNSYEGSLNAQNSFSEKYLQDWPHYASSYVWVYSWFLYLSGSASSPLKPIIYSFLDCQYSWNDDSNCCGQSWNHLELLNQKQSNLFDHLHHKERPIYNVHDFHAQIN